MIRYRISKVCDHSFSGRECEGTIVYDIKTDSWKVTIDIKVKGFKSSDHAGQAVWEAIDSFDMKLMQIKTAEKENDL